MKKLIKWFSIFAVIGAAIGLAIAYFCKDSSDDLSEDREDLTEDEDFDLDADLSQKRDGGKCIRNARERLRRAERRLTLCQPVL